MSKGVEWVVNRLRVHLSTIGRLTLKIQRVGDDKGIRTRIGRRQAKEGNSSPKCLSHCEGAQGTGHGGPRPPAGDEQGMISSSSPQDDYEEEETPAITRGDASSDVDPSHRPLRAR